MKIKKVKSKESFICSCGAKIKRGELCYYLIDEVDDRVKGKYCLNCKPVEKQKDDAKNA